MTSFGFSKRTLPLPRDAWILCSTRREAVPPIWKVLMVSWVPGSPMLWAARMPMASPMDTVVPWPRSRP